MPRVSNKHFAAAVLTSLVVGCAGGGGGCSSCGGMTPLADGFKPEDRIENAGSVRLTQSGLDFIEQNLGTLAQTLLGGMGSGGVVTFPVSTSTGSLLFIDYTVCQGGPDPNANPPKCVAEIDIGNAQLQIDSTAPHNLHVHGPLPIRLQNLPILIDYGLGITDTAIATLNGNGACPPGNQTYANIDLDVDISIEIDTDPAHSRRGYSRVKIGQININQNQLEAALHLDCGGSITGSLLDALKGLVIGQLIAPLTGTIDDQLAQALCQQANPMVTPSCPSGTTDDGSGTCVYADGTCASIILGLDGHMDLGGLLASVSPGTSGGVDILFAAGGEGMRDDGSGFAWGDLNPVGGGMTLGMYGGTEPMPVSKCVKFSDIPLPTGIPIPDELVANTVQDWPAMLPGPHLGIAVSERFANYALNGMYNSGLLCLGITTDTVPLLNSGTLGLVVPSSAELTIQKEGQPIAIVVRPGAPPNLTFGNGTNIDTDPLLRVKMDKASFDFYVWSLDRFIRFMTATYDLDIPVNLVVTPDGLVPVLDKIGVNNGTVSNNDLLREDPATIADSLGSLIAGQVGQAVGGGIAPIDLNGALASLGLTLVIPESVDGQGSPGLRRLTKGQDAYLGIFAALGTATPVSQLVANTTVELTNKHVDAAGLRLGTMTRDNGPGFRMVMASDLDNGMRAVEYSYRIDDGAWHPFTRQRIIDVQDDWLRLQGRHVVAARARVVGDATSLDPTPAMAEMVVDVDPPAISVGRVEDGAIALNVFDRVSGAVQARYSLDGGDWSPWMTASEIASVDVGEAAEIDVEAVDEEGNVGTTTQALIRGRVPADASGGCSCDVAGGPRSGGAAGWLAGLAMAAIALRIGRRRVGRNGGGNGGNGGRPAAPLPRGRRGGSGRRAPEATRSPECRTLARRVSFGATGLAALVAMGMNAGCSCGEDIQAPQCVAPACQTLDPGLIGAYTSVAVSGSTIWVAGYAEANWVYPYSWGDLVVGQWNGSRVGWAAIDGVPAEPPVNPKEFNTGAFRGGQTDPGDDVGLWTSIAIGPDGQPAVAYYDRTNRALRFAQVVGGRWATQILEQDAHGDFGRYAKLAFVNGVPVIAYLAMQPGQAGAVTSSLRLATGARATPGEGEWTFEDVDSDDATPCRAFLCDSTTECVASTGLCTKPLSADACASPCATDEACVDEGGTPTCLAVYGPGKFDTYPDAIGDYIAVAPDGAGDIGIAYYDRIHGNLKIASRSGGAWSTRIVDGEAPDGTNTGDVGMGASLFIDGAGDWHLAYADGLSEGLRYVMVKGGTSPGTSEVADDGLGIEGTPFDDGQHIVGDDASILVTSSGEVHISYQDATRGKLRHAVGTASGSGHSWLISEIDQAGFAGAFSHMIDVGGNVMIANWWRTGGQDVRGDVAIVAP